MAPRWPRADGSAGSCYLVFVCVCGVPWAVALREERSWSTVQDLKNKVVFVVRNARALWKRSSPCLLRGKSEVTSQEPGLANYCPKSVRLHASISFRFIQFHSISSNFIYVMFWFWLVVFSFFFFFFPLGCLFHFWWFIFLSPLPLSPGP